VDVASLPRAERAIAFAVDPAKGRLSFVIGREYQPDFFEKLVQKPEQRGTISRSHFELAWEPPATAPTLRKLSGNPLLIDDRPVSGSEPIRVPDGTRVAFASTDDSQRFLVLRVTLRSRGAVRAEGRHPALDNHRKRSAVPGGPPIVDHMATIKPAQMVAAVLECVHSVGGDPLRLTQDERAIAIPVDENVEIGRHHQPNFYERLLQGDNRWLQFISRSHCRVILQRLPGAGPMATASGYGLTVENLSTNAIMIKRANKEVRMLGKGRSDVMNENDRLVFIAIPGGTEGEIQFLEFLLRRARGCT